MWGNSSLHTAQRNLNLAGHLLVGGTAATPGTNGLAVDGSGNVGIGTSAPVTPLDVAGVVRSSTGGSRFPDNTTQVTAAGAIVGDIKQGLQAADHAGWVKLDGRATSTLTASQ